MKKNYLDEHLKNLAKEIYSFVFAIIPDDFHIGKITEDAFVVSSVNDRPIYTQIQKYGLVESLIFELHLNIFKYAFNMAKARSKQLEFDLEWRNSRPLTEKEIHFYLLSPEERAILFVWTHLKNRINLFCKILGFKEEAFFEKVLEVRSKLLNNISHDIKGLSEWK